MTKKIIFFAFFYFSSSILFAETCPSISDIKYNQLKIWHAFNSNNGSPVTNVELENFKLHVTNTALAEWMKDAPEGEAHCYYYNNVNKFEPVYLAANNLKPCNGEWKEKQRDIKQCQNLLNLCEFK